MRRWAGLMLGLVGFWSVTAGELTLAEKGKPAEYTVITARDAAPSVKNAAGELIAFVEKITGVKLPAADDSAPLPERAILIGENRHTAALLAKEYAPEKLSDDAFLLKTSGQHLIVLGKKRGALYGVYELLERFGHCRWYASFYSVIPPAERFAVPDDLNDLQNPAFAWRDDYWYDMLFFTMQAVRNRCNGSATIPDEWGGKLNYCNTSHALGGMVPADKYFDRHPEYFCERGGKRQKSNYQLCLSNPDVLKIVTERTLEIVRQSKNGKIVCVDQNDNNNYCECAECKKLLAKYSTQSGVMIWFVNQVAAAVEKEFPDVYVQTLAYLYTRKPPENIRVHDRIIVRLCDNECDFAHALNESTDPANVSFLDDIAKWAKISKQLMVWDYVTNFKHYMAPHPNWSALQKNLQLFREYGAINVLEQGNYQSQHGEFAELRGWVLAKLLWNPDADMNALIDDFMQGYYGAGAPFIRQYLNELQARVADKNIHFNTFSRITAPYLEEAFMKRACELFEEALAAVKDNEKISYNVKKSYVSVLYARLARAGKFTPQTAWSAEGAAWDAESLDLLRCARKFIEYADLGKACFVSEGESPNGDFYRYWRGIAQSDEHIASAVLRQGRMRLALSPQLHGMVGYFSVDGKYNCIAGELGGVCGACAREEGSACIAVGDGKKSLQTKGGFGKKGVMESEATMAGNGFKLRYKVQSEEAEVFLWEAALRLENEANIAYRLGKEKKFQLKSVPDKFENALVEVDGAQLFRNGNRMQIASPATGRVLEIQFPAGCKLHHVALQILPADGAVKVIAPIAVTGNGTPQTLDFALQVHGKLPGLLRSRKFTPPATRAILLEENAFGLSPQYGEFTGDVAAGNGRAGKLYNTHYQWSFDTDLAPLHLTAGQKYELWFRLRVDKTAETGEVFWAGIYNSSRNETPGAHGIEAKEVKDGYNWYFICTWIANPADRMDIWSGPGQFSGTKTNPAHNGVYVDAVKVIPVE